MPSSPSSAAAASALERRQLVRPTTHIPWSVDVVSVAPKKLVETLPKVVAGASVPGWACVTAGDGYLNVWQHTTSVPLSDALESPHHHKIFCPDLLIDESSEMEDDEPKDQIFLAMSGDLDSVNIYALYKEVLILRKITSKELQTKQTLPRSPTAKLRVSILDYDNGERFVGLTVAPDSNLVLLRTSTGALHWATHTAVPVGLHVQTVAPSKSFLGRLFGSSDAHSTGPRWALPLGPLEFISISSSITSDPTLVHWKVSLTMASAHNAIFDPIRQTTLPLTSALPDGSCEILKVALAADGQSIHMLVRNTFQKNKKPKLYWLVLQTSDGTVQATHWLSRFADPESVQVIGLTPVDNGNSYAAFTHHGTVIVMVLVQDLNIVQEVDLPVTQVPSILPGFLQKDTMTHGCSLLASSGIGLRVRYLAPGASSPAKKARLSVSSTNPAHIHTLVSHLRSTFWQAYQDPQAAAHRPLPPSLKQAAESSDLEQAVVTFATELQHKGDSSSAQNPMEWHKAFCRLLQQGGLYRGVSQAARWQLLSIGQELAVFSRLCVEYFSSTNNARGGLHSYDLGEWLLEQQQQQLPQQQTSSSATDASSFGDSSTSEWTYLLASTLDAARAFREEFAITFYDIVTEAPPHAIWLSQPSVQQVLLRQLEAWRRNPNGVEFGHVESVVKAALESYSESYDSKETLARIKVLAVGLLRSLNQGDDELAFELSMEYDYFEGLCQISVDHERKRDANLYSLDPLFATIQGNDLMSGMTFAQFVLQWHTDHGLYGHAINYGRHSTTDLTMIMKQDERLRNYQWIPFVRQGFFNQATESCLGMEDKTPTLAQSHWAFSMAKLANKLVANPNANRQKKIERKLELVSAQQMLDGESSSRKDTPLRTPEELVQMALTQFVNAQSTDDRVRLSTIALAVCAAMEDSSASAEHTAQVWAESLRVDADRFAKWLQTENDLTAPELRDRVLMETVFGALLLECRKDDSMAAVTYGRHIESAIVDQIGEGETTKMEFSRLLRSVTAQADAIKGKSLVVASY